MPAGGPGWITHHVSKFQLSEFGNFAYNTFLGTRVKRPSSRHPNQVEIPIKNLILNEKAFTTSTISCLVVFHGEIHYRVKKALKFFTNLG